MKNKANSLEEFMQIVDLKGFLYLNYDNKLYRLERVKGVPAIPGDKETDGQKSNPQEGQ